MSGEPVLPAGDDTTRAHLRLIWSNPRPPRPRAPVDLAAAIEGHLTGGDGLSDEEFLRVYSRRAAGGRPDWAEVGARCAP